MLRSNGALRKVLVRLVGAGEQLFEPVHADGDGDRQADGRPQRVAPADPVPELEHVGGVDPERGHRLGIGGQGGEVAGDCRFVAAGLQQPVPGRCGVGHRLLGGERLRGDQKQGGGGIEGLHGLGDIGAVDVGHEVHAQVGGGVGRERAGHHPGPEIGAADADVDHVGDRVAAVAAPGAGAHAVAERAHAGEHPVDLGHHVGAVDQDGPVGPVAQRDVQHRAPFGGVDPVARKHRFDRAGQAGLPRQGHEQLHGLAGDAILRVVEQDVAKAQREAVEAAGVGGEQLAHVAAVDGAPVRGQVTPRRQLGQR